MSILFSLIFLYSCQPESKHNTGNDDLKIFIDQITTQAIPDFDIKGGIAIGIVKDGKVLLEEAYGFSNYSQQLPALPTTPFYIASITKSFIGTLAAMLHEEGVIDLEAPLEEYLSYDLPESINLDEIWLEDLFTHTSGIGNATVGLKTAYTGNFNDHELVSDLEQYSYPVTNEFRYSNLGYILAGMIFEEQTGSDWKELLNEKIFSPLKMTQSSANISFYDSSQLAKPHVYSRGTVSTGEMIKKDNTMHAAGGLFTTIEDMNKWMNFQLTHQPPLLEEESFDYIHTDLVGYYLKSGSFNNYGYGLGWFITDWNEYDLSQHGGGYPGYRALCILSRDEMLGITILMNQASPAIQLLADQILSHFLQVPEVDSLLSARKKQVSGLWDRYKYFTDSIGSIQSKKLVNERLMEQYEGIYQNKEVGELMVKNVSGTLTIMIGNLTFESNYMGDDRFFYFNDADQLTGTVDFYFLNDQDPDYASSLEISGREFVKIQKTGQNQ